MLFKPDAQTRDPERKISTTFSTLLTEMELTRETYMQQVRETLEAVARLNESRPPEGQITVRYYSEKPTFQAIIFDDAALAFSWCPREEKSLIDMLEIEASPENGALHETYRRHFARIWGQPIARKDDDSRVIKKSAEERPWRAARGNGSQSVRLARA